MSEKKRIDLETAVPNKKKTKRHTPSQIQADTLFTFTTRLEYLVNSIKTSMLAPRYCEENIKYLKIPKIKKVAYPMKCFCDINMHKLGIHLEWYGYYGLAFSKEWGMRNGIQPVQYINPDSKLREDFSIAFSAALSSNTKKETRVQSKLKNFILHEMLYYKPYEGKIENRNTGKLVNKCFTDECEWRFIPEFNGLEFDLIYTDENMINAGILNKMSDALAEIQSVTLKFDYKDLKYIIVKTLADFKILVDRILLLNLSDLTTRELISKIIIWDNSKGDF
mgnify:CR=1 FL=1